MLVDMMKSWASGEDALIGEELLPSGEAVLLAD